MRALLARGIGGLLFRGGLRGCGGDGATPAPWRAPAPAAEAGRPRPASLAEARSARDMTARAGTPGAEACGGKRALRGVVFDMDGTLTVPVIDFALMRRRVGVTQGDILDVINSWPEAERARAHAAIQEIEQQALADMQLMPGLHELCDLLDSAGVPRGLITRNVKSSIEYFHARHFNAAPPFEPAISRECAFPYKPSPAALLHICASWGVPPSECLMVGDSAKDDIVSGNRAGALTALLDVSGTGPPPSAGSEAAPTHFVRSLSELRRLLEERYVLLPPAGESAAAAAAAGAAAAAAAAVGDTRGAVQEAAAGG